MLFSRSNSLGYVLSLGSKQEKDPKVVRVQKITATQPIKSLTSHST